MNNEQYEITIKQTWFKLLVDGVFKFYTKYEVLEKYITLLESEGLDTYFFDCNDWENAESFWDDYRIKITKGKSESEILPNNEGYIFIFKNFEHFFINHFNDAIRVINIGEEISRNYLLFGKKLLIFLNSNGGIVNKKLLQINEPLITPIRMIDSDFSEDMLRRKRQ
ncbi:hypothetical protein CSC2_05140 [Clostridium zeae]|uniref:Uncharacterized protein n=1 Tax=Clostridium zeae TaxID=2759022 RepID=A0ABQ1E5H5_9CLOT|nr:hypothetical protein [Clostridium zeae]GFZ29988.1 hypothetical protein CSC2_05140 [Clostridium zeae]